MHSQGQGLKAWRFQDRVKLAPPHRAQAVRHHQRGAPGHEARQRGLPTYTLLSDDGDDHAKVFRVGCVLAEPPLSAEGEGGSRRAAEQVAAQAVLALLAPSKI